MTNETKKPASIDANRGKTVFSAIQPSGELHIGNYLGALKNFIELQDQYECFFFVADYHSITENYEAKKKPKQIMSLALDMLAAGLDPNKCIIAVQSHICEHAELAWIFNTITPMAFLERMTQYKDKALAQKQNVNVGLFDYPVLQAADILIYKAEFVPVGQDQVQHVELTRDIAKFFNNKFGKTFAEPKPILTKTAKIMSLTDPTKKMSKSMGSKSYIGINDSPEIITGKLKKAITLTSMKEFVEKGIISINVDKDYKLTINYIDEKFRNSENDKFIFGILNLVMLLSNFATEEHYKYFINKINNAHKEDVRFSELKEVLAKDIAKYFAPFREKRKELEAKPEEVKKILAEGAEKARKVAKETMKEVKEKIGLMI